MAKDLIWSSEILPQEDTTFLATRAFFREKFAMLCKRVEIYARMRRPRELIDIQELFVGGRVSTIAFLCYLLENEAYDDGKDRTLIAFKKLFCVVPGSGEIGHYLNAEDISRWNYPLIVLHRSENCIEYYIYHQTCLMQIVECSDAVDALYTLLTYHIENGFPFPADLAFFYDYLNFFVLEAPSRPGFMRPSGNSSALHEMLCKTSVKNIFSKLNL